MQHLIDQLEKAEGPDRELDAAIYAFVHVPRLSVKRAPPTDDFGPKDRWQFFTEDGNYFLGTESRYEIPPLTASIDAALTLVPEGWEWSIDSGPYCSACQGPDQPIFIGNHKKYHSIALCIAALSARAQGEGE